jgi:hypothetical protein
MSIVVEQQVRGNGEEFVVKEQPSAEQVIKRVGVGEILVCSTKGFEAKITLGEKFAALEFIHFRIIQLLTQCMSSIMYVVLMLDNTRIPVMRRWMSQMVVMGAFLIQFQAWRKRKDSLIVFLKNRFKVIGFYVFIFCYSGYLVVTINYFVSDAIPLLVGATCSWTAFLLGLTDVFIQINQFTIPTLHAN